MLDALQEEWPGWPVCIQPPGSSSGLVQLQSSSASNVSRSKFQHNIYIYTYIYISCIYIYTYIHTHTYTMYIYIYKNYHEPIASTIHCDATRATGLERSVVRSFRELTATTWDYSRRGLRVIWNPIKKALKNPRPCRPETKGAPTLLLLLLLWTLIIYHYILWYKTYIV